jgi:hypothetical protein
VRYSGAHDAEIDAMVTEALSTDDHTGTALFRTEARRYNLA